MKKKLLLITLLTLSLLDTHAQGLLSRQNDTASNRTLFERLTNMEKKTHRFNLKLHMQTTFNGTFADSSMEQVAFKMNQFRMEASGDVNGWLSYRWRQRLNSSNIPHNLDNLPSSIDYAMLSVRLTDKLTTSIGKQAAAYGGFEYDLDPIEIYQYSDMIDYMLFDFMTGVTFSYQVNPTQEIALQVVNSRTTSMKDIYGQLPNGIEKSKAPLAYSINWNGNFLNNTLRTRWSYSLLCQAKKYNNYFYALGNELDLGKFNMFLDFYLSDEELDNRGIISSICRIQQDQPCAKNARYESWVTKLNYRFRPKWNIFVKCMYENAFIYKYSDQMEKGKYRTAYGYFAGVEYYPITENLRFFASYIGRSYHFSNKTKLLEVENYSTSTLSIGLMYHIPLF